MNLQDPQIRQAVKAAVGEVSASMTRMEAERDLIKEIAKKLNEDHGISKKIFLKTAKAYHKQSYDREVADFDEFQTVHETLFGPQKD